MLLDLLRSSDISLKASNLALAALVRSLRRLSQNSRGLIPTAESIIPHPVAIDLYEVEKENNTIFLLAISKITDVRAPYRFASAS